MSTWSRWTVSFWISPATSASRLRYALGAGAAGLLLGLLVRLLPDEELARTPERVTGIEPA